jgi:hypothetical protein
VGLLVCAGRTAYAKCFRLWGASSGYRMKPAPVLL